MKENGIEECIGNYDDYLAREEARPKREEAVQKAVPKKQNVTSGERSSNPKSAARRGSETARKPPLRKRKPRLSNCRRRWLLRK